MKTENLTTDVKMSELSLEAIILELNRRMDMDYSVVKELEHDLEIQIKRSPSPDFFDEDPDLIDLDGDEHLVIELDTIDSQMKADLIRENFDKVTEFQLRRFFEEPGAMNKTDVISQVKNWAKANQDNCHDQAGNEIGFVDYLDLMDFLDEL